MTRRIFISSVQLELAAERKAVVDGVSANPQLARFFSTFAFEFDVPVQDKRTDEVYLSELASSDVYVCIIGNEYGGITPDGISATECEYDEATRLGLPRFVFVKGKSDARRDKRERALYFVQYSEEVGSGTTDIFEHCASHGLERPIFEVDARHVSVTVMRPTFDEHGRKVGRKTSEVGAKGTEVGQKMAELGAKGKEVGQKTSEVGQKNAEVGAKGKKLGANPAEVGANGEEFRANFDFAMANYRKDFRETCFKVWQLLREDSSLTQRDIYPRLRLAYSSVQSAYNALQEVGLLRREGRGKGSNWIVLPQPPLPITKPLEPRTNARKPVTKRRVSAKKGKETK